MAFFAAMPREQHRETPREKPRKEERCRSGALLIAGWYLVLTTEAPFSLLDWIAPLTKTVAGAGFPCARQACGCRSEGDCRSRCCCSHGLQAEEGASRLSSAAGESSPFELRVARVSDARCQGRFPGQGLAGEARAGPHLIPLELVWIPFELETRRWGADRPVPPSSSPSPPDKVPI